MNGQVTCARESGEERRAVRDVVRYTWWWAGPGGPRPGECMIDEIQIGGNIYRFSRAKKLNRLSIYVLGRTALQ